jgi:hypothetical protein
MRFTAQRRCAAEGLGESQEASGEQIRSAGAKGCKPEPRSGAWHNNHHAFPTSARHGLGRWQLDPGAWLITALERCHLAWDVVRIAPERQQAGRAAGQVAMRPALERHPCATCPSSHQTGGK